MFCTKVLEPSKLMIIIIKQQEYSSPHEIRRVTNSFSTKTFEALTEIDVMDIFFWG